MTRVPALPTRIAVALTGGALAIGGFAAVSAPAQAAPAAPVVSSGSAGYPSHYAAARHAWKHGARVSAADASRYQRRAEHRLEAAGHRYDRQARQLDRLISIPLTSLTPEQQKHARHLTRELDRFFHTPGLYF